MFLTNNPFENYGPNKQALTEAKQSNPDKFEPFKKKKNEADDYHYATGERVKKKEKKESVGKTAGDKSYYNLQRAKDLAKKDGHDYDKLPQYDRTHDKHKDHYDAKAKKESVKSESFKYHIPEDIPANERTAFHGAAAAAAKQNKKSFNFGGKTHPVTMKKDLANKIADQKESMSFREKLMSLYEGDRAAHYKGATAPEGMHDKFKSSKGAMDMVNVQKSVEADGMKAAKDTADNIKKSIPGRKMRSNDKKDGDNTIIPAATPVKDPAAKMQTAESYGASGNAIPNSLLDAIGQVTEKRQIRTNRVRGDRTMHDDHVKKGMGMGGEQTYSTVNKLDQRHYAKYISKKSGHDSYFDGNDLVHKKSSKTVVPNALISKNHSPNQLADKMKAHGDKHKG